MTRALISSTYLDLKAHWVSVIARLPAAGIFVEPMEKWTAAYDEPKELSMTRVKDCHLRILLVGFRLSHVPKGEQRSIIQIDSWFNDLQAADVSKFAGVECGHGPTALQGGRGDDQVFA
jgi:hypothetical protein